MNPITFPVDHNGSALRVGIVRSRYNEDLSLPLQTHCLAELASLGVLEDDVTVLTVPGALEIPLALAHLAESGEFDALIALGVVVRGETYHFEIVANQSAAGVMRVSLDTGLPVVNGILTTENEAQATARAESKGRECARVAVELVNLVEALEPEDELEEQ